MSRQALVDNVNHYVKQLHAAVAELDRFDALPENHKYPTLEAAKAHLEEWLCQKARDACENLSQWQGAEVYSQEFSVEGKRYRSVLHVAYNRHDKTYYCVDSTEFHVVEL